VCEILLENIFSDFSESYDSEIGCAGIEKKPTRKCKNKSTKIYFLHTTHLQQITIETNLK